MGATNITLSANIQPGAGCQTHRKTAGETIAAGQAAYLNAADGRVYRALGDTAAHAACQGIAVNSANAGQFIELAYDGEVQNLSGLQVGRLYVVSDDSAGALMQGQDLDTGDFACFIGIPRSASVLRLRIFNSELAYA
jgi:hypothetical protein